MNNGKYVFSQVITFLPSRLFDKYVAKYGGNKWVKHFSCWNQLLCMMFGQLSNRDSLRDLMVCINAHLPKHYHLGFGRGVSRSNLANANEKRSYRIYEEFAYELISEARTICQIDPDFQLSVKGNIYAFDSSVVDLCLNVFWWATFRKAKAGIKLHTLLDVKTNIPAYIHITTASTHDVNGLDLLDFEEGGYYVLDRGYVDFNRLYKIHKKGAFFVTRAKSNNKVKRIYSAKADKDQGILYDQQIKLEGAQSFKSYPEKFRRIKFYDAEQKRTFIFITNNLELSAIEIALLYKYRWKVELFFKWIKQHLKLLSFWGTSKNAVKTQIYIAIITYVLVAIIRAKLNLKMSNYEILQILSVSLLDKTQLNQLFQSPLSQDVKEQDSIQLKLNLF